MLGGGVSSQSSLTNNRYTHENTNNLDDDVDSGSWVDDEARRLEDDKRASKTSVSQRQAYSKNERRDRKKIKNRPPTVYYAYTHRTGHLQRVSPRVGPTLTKEFGGGGGRVGMNI